MDKVNSTLMALAMYEFSSYNYDRLRAIAEQVIDGEITLKEAVQIVEPFDLPYFMQIHRELENGQGN